MKKTLTITAIAATILSLSALTPAQAATKYECNGATANIIVTTNSTAAQNGMGSRLSDVIAIVGPKTGRTTIVFAHAGDDIICNLSSNPVLVTGGTGEDTYYGNSQPAWFYGGEGDDAAFGGSAAENFNGGPGSDFLVGGPGNDILSGNADKDFIHGGTGTDTIIGGTGYDIVTGHGSELKDDIAKDVIYATASEILSKGRGDIYKTLPTDLIAYNATSKKAFQAKYPTSKYTTYVNTKSIGADTIIGPNLEVFYKGSVLAAVWIAG